MQVRTWLDGATESEQLMRGRTPLDPRITEGPISDTREESDDDLAAEAAKYNCVPKRAPDGSLLPATMPHDKCYSQFVLASYPAQRPWVCRNCGTQGIDHDKPIDHGEYERLIAKFGGCQLVNTSSTNS